MDVSVLAHRDAGTGIQRVTKQLLGELKASPPHGYIVRTVRASRWRKYRYADEPRDSSDVRTQPGDLFLGLDFSSRILPRHQSQLLEWRAAGVKLCVVMYDMLPLLRPEWFTRRNSRAYGMWIHTVAIHADSVACISEAVARQFNAWLADRGFTSDLPAVGWFHLGAQSTPGQPRRTADPRIGDILRHPFVLMVGTIEPRKGYAAALDAFEAVWHAGQSMRLVIVGRAGWKVDALVARLRSHHEAGRRLHWLDNASDEVLSVLYVAACGVLIASEGEGFGLPILEAAIRGKPLLLRDLPVFREIAGDAASYFGGATPEQFGQALSQWIQNLAAGDAPKTSALARQTWADSARQLLAQLPLATPTHA